MLTGGKMEHSSRDEIMSEFRTGKTQVLVTTNVLSRGVDVLGVKVVINFEVPMLYRQNQVRVKGVDGLPQAIACHAQIIDLM